MRTSDHRQLEWPLGKAEWITTALAQTSSDGDGPDGDELGPPIVLGIAMVGYIGWLAFRRWSSRNS